MFFDSLTAIEGYLKKPGFSLFSKDDSKLFLAKELEANLRLIENLSLDAFKDKLAIVSVWSTFIRNRKSYSAISIQGYGAIETTVLKQAYQDAAKTVIDEDQLETQLDDKIRNLTDPEYSYTIVWLWLVAQACIGENIHNASAQKAIIMELQEQLLSKYTVVNPEAAAAFQSLFSMIEFTNLTQARVGASMTMQNVIDDTHSDRFYNNTQNRYQWLLKQLESEVLRHKINNDMVISTLMKLTTALGLTSSLSSPRRDSISSRRSSASSIDGLASTTASGASTPAASPSPNSSAIMPPLPPMFALDLDPLPVATTASRRESPEEIFAHNLRQAQELPVGKLHGIMTFAHELIEKQGMTIEQAIRIYKICEERVRTGLRLGDRPLELNEIRRYLYELPFDKKGYHVYERWLQELVTTMEQPRTLAVSPFKRL